MIPIRRYAKRLKRFVVYNILHVDDTPHRLALGLALGMFIAFTPTIGLQMLLVLLIAPLIKANGRVGLPLVWISNPFTFVPIFAPSYWLGRTILSPFMDRPDVTFQRVKEVLTQYNASYVYHNCLTGEFWSNIGGLFLKFLNVSMDLWVGSIIIGMILAVMTYFGSYRFIVWYRTTNPHFLLHLKRMQRRKRWKEKLLERRQKKAETAKEADEEVG